MLIMLQSLQVSTYEATRYSYLSLRSETKEQNSYKKIIEK